VDVDGTVHLSAPRRVNVMPEADLEVIGANPLRAGQQLTVVAKGAANQTVRVGLYNVLGQRIRTLSASPQGKSMLRAQLAAESLPSGTYFVRTEGGGEGKTARFTVVR
jgi:hypothetical protein